MAFSVSNFCVENNIGRRKREGNRREKENKAFSVSNGQQGFHCTMLCFWISDLFHIFRKNKLVPSNLSVSVLLNFDIN